jgi:predicted lactoylglutathione lyase
VVPGTDSGQAGSDDQHVDMFVGHKRLPLWQQRGPSGCRSSRDHRRCRVGRVEQRVSLVTLGVSDYARAKAFYEALGWSVALDIEDTAFFQANGSVLVLWAREKLAEDTGISDQGARWGGIVLAHNVRSREEVHEVIEQARSNGAEIAREPSETFYGGYAGAFLDLDGHPWEVAHNPGFGLDDDGNIVLPGT